MIFFFPLLKIKILYFHIKCIFEICLLKIVLWDIFFYQQATSDYEN